MNVLERHKLFSNINNHPNLSLYRCANVLSDFDISKATVYRVEKKARMGGLEQRKKRLDKKTEKNDSKKFEEFTRKVGGSTGLTGR